MVHASASRVCLSAKYRTILHIPFFLSLYCGSFSAWKLSYIQQFINTFLRDCSSLKSKYPIACFWSDSLIGTLKYTLESMFPGDPTSNQNRFTPYTVLAVFFFTLNSGGKKFSSMCFLKVHSSFKNLKHYWWAFQ